MNNRNTPRKSYTNILQISRMFVDLKHVLILFSLMNPMIPDFCFQDGLETTASMRMVSGSGINSVLFSPLGTDTKYHMKC